MLQIIRVRTEVDAREVGLLVAEFFTWVRGRYPDKARNIDRYIRTQKIDEQLCELLTRFGPPVGECLLARVDGVSAGIVMTRPHSEGMCEVNRMFVREAARGQGVARALLTEILASAKQLGYARIMLAAGTRHTESLALYRSFGFVEDPSLTDTGAGDIEVRMSRAL